MHGGNSSNTDSKTDGFVRKYGRLVIGLVAVSLSHVSLGFTPPALGQSAAVERRADVQKARFVPQELTVGDRAIRYQVWLPEGYSESRDWPLVVFLHGAGERGDDGIRPTEVGLGAALRSSPERFPFVAVFPQCGLSEAPILEGWAADGPAAKRLMQILDEVEDRYAVDSEHRILTGWSMGGYGVWQIAAASPDKWAALLPISSGGESDLADKLPEIPIWVISGQRDTLVRPSAVQPIVQGLQNRNRRCWQTIVPHAGHDVWQTAYSSPAVRDWILNPTTRGEPPELAADFGQPDIAADFEPVLNIPSAVGVRIGNRMLEAVSYAIPRQIPPSAISGRIPDIQDSTSANGINFAVTFSNISYSGSITDARLQAGGNDRLTLAVGLRDVNLTIGSTYIRGGRRSATAGPITIGIGTRRPVWLNINARPYVKDRKLKLSVIDSSFRIDRDNWYVTRPYGVAARGWGMTESRVSNALVEGLYARRGRIESEVEAAVPSILTWVEDVIDFSSAGQAATAVWPLPVYSPVARAYPQDVKVDQQGVSLLLGLEVAAPTRRPLPFRNATAQTGVGAALDAVDDSTLSVAIAPSILRPLSQLLVESQAARINVLDIPGDAFTILTDRERLAAFLPELDRLPPTTEVRAELVLPEPLDLTAASTSNAAELLLQASAAVLEISTRTSTTEPWVPQADVLLQLQQQVAVSVETQEEFSNVTISPAGEVDVAVAALSTADLQSSLSPAAQMELRDLFAEAWNHWLSGQVLNESTLPSLDFQQTRLLLKKIQLHNGTVVAGFAIPPIRIENKTDDEHRYQVKSPTGSWSETRVLPPGDFHRYDIEYSLTYRWTQDGTTTVYTLKPGSESEFRVPVDGGPPTLFRKRVE